MPNTVSNKGVWHAAKEKVGLVNKSDKPIEYNGETIQPGEPFIYNGPDREAVKMLHEQGFEDPNGNWVMGSDFRNDPEFLKSLQAYGFSSDEEGVAKYLKRIGYNEEEDKKKFKERASVIKRHELPKRHDEILVMGGGKSHSGHKEDDMIGGFGPERVRKPAEIKK